MSRNPSKKNTIHPPEADGDPLQEPGEAEKRFLVSDPRDDPDRVQQRRMARNHGF